MWRAWQPDAFTITWVVWLTAGLAIETAALRSHYDHTLTAHLRPVFLWQPLAWYVGLGVCVWFIVHVFAPSVEAWIVDAVARGLS